MFSCLLQVGEHNFFTSCSPNLAEAFLPSPVSVALKENGEGVVPTQSITHPSTSSFGVRILIHQQLDLCIVSNLITTCSYLRPV